MKKYGKIIIAFMWLGLTMIMIVGATFAWFAENRNVEAGGMEVKAETVKNLMISNASDGTYNISAESTLTGILELAPASTATALTDSAFFAAVDATRTNGYIVASSGVIASNPAVTMTTDPFRAANINAVPQNGEQHIEVAKHTFYIKSDSTALNEKLFVKEITVQSKDTSTTPPTLSDTISSDISKALRVAVVCNGTAYIFAPNYAQNSLPSYNGITGVDNSHVATTSAVTLSTPDGETQSPSCTLNVSNSTVTPIPGSTDTPFTVYVYIWYEGQDSYCTSANSANVENLVVSVKFGATTTAQ